MSNRIAIDMDRYSELVEPVIDDIVEIVQSASDCPIADISPEAWLRIKAMLLILLQDDLDGAQIDGAQIVIPTGQTNQKEQP